MGGRMKEKVWLNWADCRQLKSALAGQTSNFQVGNAGKCNGATNDGNRLIEWKHHEVAKYSVFRWRKVGHFRALVSAYF